MIERVYKKLNAKVRERFGGTHGMQRRRMTVKDLGTKRLETARLILRRFTLEDAQKMYENWAGDPEVTKFLTWPTHESAETSRQILKEWVAAYDNPEVYQWCIEEKESGEPVGSIGVVEPQ